MNARACLTMARMLYSDAEYYWHNCIIQYNNIANAVSTYCFRRLYIIVYSRAVYIPIL